MPHVLRIILPVYSHTERISTFKTYTKVFWNKLLL